MIETNFKHTDIGPIPHDWEVINLSQIGIFFRGHGIVRKDSNSGNISALRYGEIYTTHHNYVKEYVSHISREVANDSFRLKVGDICFAGYGETLQDIGKAVAITKEEEAYAGQNIVVLRPFKRVSAIFFGYMLNMPNIAIQKANRGNGSSIMLITPNALSEILVALPKLEREQIKIGKALSDIDGLIDGLRKLIEKKRNIKQGAMSYLLSGSLRLPGFNKPWETSLLLDVASYSNVTLPSDMFDAKNYVCTENMISNRGGIIPYDNYVCTYMVKSYVPYDILISNIRPYLKKIWFANCSGGVSVDVLVVRPNHEAINAKYLYTLLSHDKFFSHNMEGIAGTKMPRGNKRHIMNYEFIMPTDIAEQAAIAKVLTDMDEEIEKLEKKLAKYEQVKQGMMKQLLTGKIRLI